MAEDIRWQQRFSNYCKALERLEDFLEPPALNEREQQGLIKAFEYTYELALNTLRVCCGTKAIPPCWDRVTPCAKPSAWA